MKYNNSSKALEPNEDTLKNGLRTGVIMSETPDTMMAWTKVHDREDGFELIEHPVPSPGAGEVLIKTASTSICGTDLHAFKGDQPFFNYPRILGHELAGVVLKKNESKSSLKIGDYWHVYFDKYMTTGNRMGAVKSKDLKNWTDISDEINFPENALHGSIFKVNQKVLDNLLQLK